MTWRDKIREQSAHNVPFMGSFRGAAFIVPGNRTTGGRRTVVHELPQRDLPIVDDLGAKAKEFELEVFVDGSMVSSGNYMDARDALMAALDQAGPATLVHPWNGTLRVQQTHAYRVREDNRDGGRATFRLSLVRVTAGTESPTQVTYTPAATQQAADAADLAAINDFANTASTTSAITGNPLNGWNVTGLPDFHLNQLNDEITRTLAPIESALGAGTRLTTTLSSGLTTVEATVSGVTSTVSSLIRSPYNMGAAIIGFVHQMADIVTEPVRALRLYQGLFNAGNDSPAIPTTTAVRRQEAASAAALHAIVQRGAVIAAARQSSVATYSNRDQAFGQRDTLLDAIDTQLLATNPVTGAPISDDVYQALETLRAAVAEDLRTRGAQLPQVASFTPLQTLPALVIAQKLYGDYTRADEIISRNDIQHPGFVAGGDALEVLSV